MQLPSIPAPQNEWEVDGWWFHCFRALIDGGLLARMSGSACKVYLVIKSHANFKTGVAGPALTTIAHKSGLSLAQVKRELTSLEDYGVIRKQKVGRHNIYTLIEHFPLTCADGTPVAMGRWEYVPAKVGAATEELKRSVEAQSLNSSVLIKIDKLQLQIVEGGGQGVQIGGMDLSGYPIGLRKQFEALMIKVGRLPGPLDGGDVNR